MESSLAIEPNSLATLGLSGYVVLLMVSVLFLYAAFRSLVIRRALAVGLYRRQALWVALSGLYWFLYVLFFSTLGTLHLENPSIILANPILSYAFLLWIFVALAIAFEWVDATVRVARRSDPLLRDALAWSKLRFVMWALILGGMAYSLIYLAPPIVSASNGDPVYQVLTFYEQPVVTSIFVLVGVLCLAAVTLSRSRTQDIVLWKQLRALGVYLTALILQGLSSYLFTNLLTNAAASQTIVVALGVVVFVANGLSLARTSRVLAPTSRLKI